jgi:transcriptional regulator with XRE-family HTH domain
VGQHQHQDLVILGKAIQAVREQRGFSVATLAAVAGVSPSRVAALEDGRLDPDYELLLTLAESMGIRASAFILRAEELGDRQANNRQTST